MWWNEDSYSSNLTLPPAFTDSTLWGPLGPALVTTYEDGKTQRGWGDADFMNNYERRKFIARFSLREFTKYGKPFALVMRSARMVCVDLDGKNNGTAHEKILGVELPPTVAETSKSGNGYHLFYEVDDAWDELRGFGKFHDFIGIEEGVDFRGTGCVYHHPPQRWNNRPVAQLPVEFGERLLQKDRTRALQKEALLETLESEDKEIVLIMQSALLDDLKKPIPAGRRNNTLFAIGSQLRTAGIKEWSQLITDKATEVGLDDDEIDKLILNITRYQP